MNEKSLSTIFNPILITVFLLSIYVPLIGGFIQKEKTISQFEKRALAKLPQTPNSLQSFNEYPDALNNYFSDHFGFRDEYTKAFYNFSKNFNKQTPIDDVTMGKEGWMFLGSVKPGYKRYGDPMGDVMNVNLFSQEALEAFAESKLNYKEYLSSKGIKYLFVIVPNKHTIYFDKLPDYVTKQNSQSATDQLVTYLEKHTDVDVLDLRPYLQEGRKTHQVYYKSDTHWNHYGANIAQYAILSKIKAILPDSNISPILLSDDQFKILKRSNGDLATFAKLEHTEDSPEPIFNSGCTPENKTSSNGTQGPFKFVCNPEGIDALIFMDSFCYALFPYFTRQFRRSTYVWEKINPESLKKFLEEGKPKIVVEELVERKFPYVPPKVRLADNVLL